MVEPELTMASHGWRKPVAGLTERTLLSDCWIFHVKATGSLVQFFMVYIRVEEVPT